MSRRKDPKRGGQGQARHTAGTPKGGQFAAQANDEASVTLPAQVDRPPAVDEELPASSASTASSVQDDVVESAMAEANESRLWTYVSHPNALVRRLAAMNPHLTEPMARWLMDHQQPLGVRVNVAASHPDYASDLAANDPDRFVRVFALDPRANLPASARLALGRDDHTWNLRHIAGDALALHTGRDGPPGRIRSGPRA